MMSANLKDVQKTSAISIPETMQELKRIGRGKYNGKVTISSTSSYTTIKRAIDDWVRIKERQIPWKPERYRVTGKYITGAVCPNCDYDELDLGDRFCRECGIPIDVKHNAMQFDLMIDRIETKRKKEDADVDKS